MTRRPLGLALLLVILAAPLACERQRVLYVSRVGVVSTYPRDSTRISLPVFVAKLRDLGYIENQGLAIEYRYSADTERLRDLATELVGHGVQVIFAADPYASRAVGRLNGTIPIVGFELETRLKQTGGNLTGVVLDQSGEVSAKQLQLLTEVVPGLVRVAVIPSFSPDLKSVADAARKLNLGLVTIKWAGPGETLGPAAPEDPQGLVVVSSLPLIDLLRPAADAALKSRLPSIGRFTEFAQEGGLLAYGPARSEIYSAAATLVAKILRGARPGDLPIEQPTKFELTVNMKTAKALGLTIPQSVLGRADQIIQ